MPGSLGLLPIIISSYATTTFGANLLYLGTLAVQYAPACRSAGNLALDTRA